MDGCLQMGLWLTEKCTGFIKAQDKGWICHLLMLERAWPNAERID